MREEPIAYGSPEIAAPRKEVVRRTHTTRTDDAMKKKKDELWSFVVINSS